MRKLFFLILSVCCFQLLHAQQLVNRQEFFIEERPIEVTLTTDIKNLMREKTRIAWQPAEIRMEYADNIIITEQIRLQPRGQFRKNNCDIASLMLDFKSAAAPKLSPLKKLKFVGGCNAGATDEELLLKEYLAYKLFNHISNMSFRVRLLHVKYKDSKNKVRSYTQYAFLIEDAKEMAARNNCTEFKTDNFGSEQTNRNQMTIINLFQYMIGNTDWAVVKQHNMKLMVPNNDSTALPYAVPYDFDYCGLVNAPYAVPPEEFGTNSVTERVYRGFPRTMDELEDAIKIFQEKKSAMFYTVNNFELLDIGERKKIIQYLEDFYSIIGNKKKVNSIFIKNARKV